MDYLSDATYKWSVWEEGRAQPSGEAYEGSGMVHEFLNAGTFVVEMASTSADKRTRGLVHVKYVRRELRGLFDTPSSAQAAGPRACSTR